MAKHKISRKSTRIDMTAMCDVAFLLLSFFVMTATAKQPEPKPVDTPASTVIDKLPEDGVAVITVGDSTVFFTIPRNLRKGTLERVANIKGAEFSPEDYKKFDGLEGFGVPFSKLKSLMALKGDERTRPGIQEGIPFDSVNDQLGMWVEQAREANKQFLEEKIAAGATDLKFKDLDIAIKGDAKESYPTIKRVIDILQKQKKNRFFLVTGLRNEDF
jgi:biopolymer transport protein ExbD